MHPGSSWRSAAPHGPVDTNCAAELPEIADAIAAGYEPAPEAPLWCFVPLLWPPSHRTWLRDRRVRRTLPPRDHKVGALWATADYAEIERSHNDLLEALGLPPRPAGRIWLLKPPTGHRSVEEFLAEMLREWRHHGGKVMASPEFLEYALEEIRHAFADVI